MAAKGGELDNRGEMRESLADLCHRQWSGWMHYIFEKSIQYELTEDQYYEGALVIPKCLVERWRRQMRTEYNSLSEDEKNSDRRQADKFLQLYYQERGGEVGEND